VLLVILGPGALKPVEREKSKVLGVEEVFARRAKRRLRPGRLNEIKGCSRGCGSKPNGGEKGNRFGLT